MEGILLFIISYIVLLIFWLIFVILFFALSFIVRKNLVSIPVGLTILVSFSIQLFIIGYAIYILWQIISNAQWLLLILALIFGGFIIGWWQLIYELLLTPFTVSALYFLAKVESTDFGEDTVVGEILDKDNKVIDISEGETSVKTRFAKYFLVVYALYLIPMVIFPVEREGLSPLDYLTKPFFQIISTTLMVSIPYGIYRKIKYKSFFPKDKRYFLIHVWKIALYIFIPFMVLLYLLAIVTNTL